MANVTATGGMARTSARLNGLKPLLQRALLLLLGVAAGVWVVAPLQQRASDAFVPAAVRQMPQATVALTGEEGGGRLLVRLADTSQARAQGLNGVGAAALDDLVMLYQQPRATTSRTSYIASKLRTPLMLAAFDAEGLLVALQEVQAGTERVSFTESHRWVLAAKPSILTSLGVVEGARLEPESVRKLR